MTTRLILWPCKWGWCAETFAIKDDLVRHVLTAHIATTKKVRLQDIPIIVRAQQGQGGTDSLVPSTPETTSGAQFSGSAVELAATDLSDTSQASSSSVSQPLQERLSRSQNRQILASQDATPFLTLPSSLNTNTVSAHQHRERLLSPVLHDHIGEDTVVRVETSPSPRSRHGLSASQSFFISSSPSSSDTNSSTRDVFDVEQHLSQPRSWSSPPIKESPQRQWLTSAADTNTVSPDSIQRRPYVYPQKFHSGVIHVSAPSSPAIAANDSRNNVRNPTVEKDQGSLDDGNDLSISPGNGRAEEQEVTNAKTNTTTSISQLPSSPDQDQHHEPHPSISFTDSPMPPVSKSDQQGNNQHQHQQSLYSSKNGPGGDSGGNNGQHQQQQRQTGVMLFETQSLTIDELEYYAPGSLQLQTQPRVFSSQSSTNQSQ